MTLKMENVAQQPTNRPYSVNIVLPVGAHVSKLKNSFRLVSCHGTQNSLLDLSPKVLRQWVAHFLPCTILQEETRKQSISPFVLTPYSYLSLVYVDLVTSTNYHRSICCLVS